uniref:Resistin n=1 Tax=Canis lupus dingo TaxID=286419 RepID=A0A8C0KMN6_CANLU
IDLEQATLSPWEIDILRFCRSWTLPFHRMKTTCCFLLPLFLLQPMIPGTAPCSLDFILDTKIKETLTGLELHPSPTQRILSSCPAGMTVTGCACGYGCGSWDIRGETTCHCQCSIIDWTTAHCCPLT